jgi:hypothetical protein
MNLCEFLFDFFRIFFANCVFFDFFNILEFWIVQACLLVIRFNLYMRGFNGSRTVGPGVWVPNCLCLKIINKIFNFDPNILKLHQHVAHNPPNKLCKN